MAQAIARDFFIYPLTFSALAAGTSQTQNISVQQDSNFVLRKIGYAADISAAAQTDSSRVIPLVSVIITDQGSGRQIMSGAVPLSIFIGDGRLPFILPQPKVFLARTVIAVTLANYSLATTYNVYLGFIGEKEFYA